MTDNAKAGADVEHQGARLDYVGSVYNLVQLERIDEMLFSHAFIPSEAIHWSYKYKRAREIKFLLSKHDENLSLDPNAHGKAGHPLHIYNPALGGGKKRQTDL